ncbi:lysylphosphatidylglycerol synthase domain-containing protein [Cylindrospermopsis raciborskii G7]|uniref:lysylphosphatidylglycerol synthase domain-containing protein n=1 Tax=Cylindrospermopsis raciborskii TaxID=77022 RepID=UPI001BA7C90A|nr:lysylphosphatidylglycerol synthase domain-containing protein [Cylindrospermopsis raciborskii]
MAKFSRWVVFGVTLLFLAKTLQDHWLEVNSLSLVTIKWKTLILATIVTLLAHTWAGWVWTWILKDLNQSVPTGLFIRVYLKTNVAKYLPGNVWHYYGRILTAKNTNIPTLVATLSVLLEPLLMATAALFNIILLPNKLSFISLTFNHIPPQILQFISLCLLLGAIHPAVLNPALGILYQIKSKIKLPKKTPLPVNSSIQPINNLILEHYPLLPLMGELIFVYLRGTGFILTISAVSNVDMSQIPVLMGSFSLSWVLGLIIPGAPGGIGVFEATAILVLDDVFPPAILISAIALYRLISILAETIGAAIGYLL